MRDTMRVHDAEFNSNQQIFGPLIQLTLGYFRIQQCKHLQRLGFGFELSNGRLFARLRPKLAGEPQLTHGRISGCVSRRALIRFAERTIDKFLPSKENIFLQIGPETGWKHAPTLRVNQRRYNLARQENLMKMILADCRVKITIDVIRGKWKPIIIKALKVGGLGYADLRRIVPEPTKKVLTDHLRELEADRIISRTASAGRNGRPEYSLTEYGQTLIPVLTVMRAWGQTHRELVLGQPRNAEDDSDPCAIPPIPVQRRAHG